MRIQFTKKLFIIFALIVTVFLTGCESSDYSLSDMLNDMGDALSEGANEIEDSVSNLVDELSKIGATPEPTPEIQIPEETYEVNLGTEIHTEENSLDVSDYKDGDTILFGEYEQDGDKKNGKEPIEWIILEKNDEWIFVVSKFALDYDNFFNKAGTTDRKVVEHWEGSYIRGWLNKEFYAESFQDSDKLKILETKVSTFDDPESTYYYNDSVITTNDKIFLLSISDVRNTKYGFKELKDGNMGRRCKGTKYAIDKAFKKDDNGYVEYWLRSQGNTEELHDKAFHGKRHYRAGAVVVQKDGYVSSYSSSFDRRFIRPAMFIRVKK